MIIQVSKMNRRQLMDLVINGKSPESRFVAAYELERRGAAK